jgi:hypothetical protein
VETEQVPIDYDIYGPHGIYGPPVKSKRTLFEEKEAKRLESLVTSEYDSLVVLGQLQAIVPIITDAGQQIADEMGVPIGKVSKFYLQPPNRQYFRRAFKEYERAERSVKRDEFLKSIKHTPKADPSKLSDHLIHEIYKKRGVSIRWKQHKIGMIGKTYDLSAAKPIFSPQLFTKILKRRGKKRAVHHEMEYESRVINRAA